MLIGLAGNTILIKQKLHILSALGFDCLILDENADWQAIDGLILSGTSLADWSEHAQITACLQDPRWRNQPILAEGLGSLFLDKAHSRLLSALVETHTAPNTAELISVPSWDDAHLLAHFSGGIYFSDIAPNIAVLAQTKRRGALILRQRQCASSKLYQPKPRNLPLLQSDVPPMIFLLLLQMPKAVFLYVNINISLKIGKHLERSPKTEYNS